jgi:hypothetical protein
VALIFVTGSDTSAPIVLLAKGSLLLGMIVVVRRRAPERADT